MQASLHQDILIGSHNVQIKAVRPHLYRHRSPAGTLSLQIQDLRSKKVILGDTVVISDIGAGATFAHGYVAFDINALLKAETSYRVSLTAGGGYSFSESAYVAWCNDYDLRKVPAGWTPSDGFHAALDMELWHEAEVLKGST